MRRPAGLGAVAALAIVLVVLTACGDDATTILPEGESPTDSPTPTATLPPIPEADTQQVDAVVQVLRTQDMEAMRPYIGLRPAACAADAAAEGAPMCRDGESPGDAVDAFFLSECTGRYIREDEIDQPLLTLTTMDVVGAYRIPRRTEAGYQYSVVLTKTAGANEGMAWEAIVETGQVIGLLYSCSLTPEELVEVRGYQEEVPPPGQPGATPPP